MEFLDYIGQFITIKLTPEFLLLAYIAWAIHKRVTKIEDKLVAIEAQLAPKNPITAV